MRASDRLHDRADQFGAGGPMTEEELDALEAGRHGSLPWKQCGDAKLDRPLVSMDHRGTLSRPQLVMTGAYPRLFNPKRITVQP